MSKYQAALENKKKEAAAAKMRGPDTKTPLTVQNLPAQMADNVLQEFFEVVEKHEKQFESVVTKLGEKVAGDLFAKVLSDYFEDHTERYVEDLTTVPGRALTPTKGSETKAAVTPKLTAFEEIQSRILGSPPVATPTPPARTYPPANTPSRTTSTNNSCVTRSSLKRAIQEGDGSASAKRGRRG